MNWESKVYRVWWRLPGADPDRPTGPWWHRDLHDPAVMRRFVRDHVEVAEDVRLWVLRERPTKGSPLNKRPPEGATSCMFWLLLPEEAGAGDRGENAPPGEGGMDGPAGPGGSGPGG